MRFHSKYQFVFSSYACYRNILIITCNVGTLFIVKYSLMSYILFVLIQACFVKSFTVAVLKLHLR